MSEPKWLLGMKWRVAEDRDYGLHLIWTEEGDDHPGILIARTCFAPASHINAHLISAAPELYKALFPSSRMNDDRLSLAAAAWVTIALSLLGLGLTAGLALVVVALAKAMLG